MGVLLFCQITGRNFLYIEPKSIIAFYVMISIIKLLASENLLLAKIHFQNNYNKKNILF